MGGQSSLVIMAEVSWAPVECGHCTQPLPVISVNPHTLSIHVTEKGMEAYRI